MKVILCMQFYRRTVEKELYYSVLFTEGQLEGSKDLKLNPSNRDIRITYNMFNLKTIEKDIIAVFKYLKGYNLK